MCAHGMSRVLSVRSGRISKPSISTRIGPSKLDRFHAQVRLPDTPYRWIIGHTTMNAGSPMVLPGRTYVVYLSAPGWMLSSYAILTSAGLAQKLRTQRKTMRRFMLGEIPLPRLTSTQFFPSSWRRHLHGPGDTMPNHTIETFDYGNQAMDDLMGVQEVGRPVTDHGRSTTIAQLVRESGPGIYFVIGCRGTPGQNWQELRTAMYRNVSTASRFGRGQLGQPPVNRTGLVQRTYLQNTIRTRALKKRVRTVRTKPKVKFHPIVRRVRSIFVRRRPRV